MNLNKKILNWSIIITLLIAYITPGRSADGFAFNYGHPFGFFTMYNTRIKVEDSILNSTAFNLVGFILNILLIYLIFHILNKFISKKSGKESND